MDFNERPSDNYGSCRGVGQIRSNSLHSGVSYPHIYIFMRVTEMSSIK